MHFLPLVFYTIFCFILVQNLFIILRYSLIMLSYKNNMTTNLIMLFNRLMLLYCGNFMVGKSQIMVRKTPT